MHISVYTLGEKIMRKFAFITLAVLSTQAFAFKMNKINVKINDSLKNKLSLELTLKKGLFKKEFRTISKDLSSSESVLKLDSIKNVTQIDYKLILNSDINVDRNDIQEAVLTGKIKLRGRKSLKSNSIARDRLKISTEHKFKADIECDNIIDVKSTESKSLTIDLSSFENLSKCSGDDIAEYSISGIPFRKVSAGRNKYSIEDDKRLGLDFVNQFEKENSEIILSTEHPMSKYMQYQMEQIAKHSDMPELVPRVRVINADVLNAFALPGGYVYVFRGLIERAPDLHSVMGVLGHEWAHVTARHGTRGMTRGIRAITVGIGIAAIGVIGAEFIDDDKALLKQIVKGSAMALGLGGAQMYILSRGRQQELEADRLGSQYAQSAGFKPTGIATMFREFKRLAPQGNSTLEKALSSHPHHDERIDKNLIYSSLFYPKANIQRNHSAIVNGEEIRYEDALAQLSSMSIPSKVESESVASAFVQTLHSQNEMNILKDVQPLIDSLQSSIEERQEAETKEEEE
jgi:hypothetical protein